MLWGWKKVDYMFAHQKVEGPNVLCGKNAAEHNLVWDQQLPGLDVNSPYKQPYPMYCTPVHDAI